MILVYTQNNTHNQKGSCSQISNMVILNLASNIRKLKIKLLVKWIKERKNN